MSEKPIIIASDLEGVLVPEIWINVAKKTGIKELNLTTRDISDYDKLMKMRIEILDREGLTLSDIRQVIGALKPLEGALEFTRWARSTHQFVILSDTFYQFASPLMKKLEWPTLFCHQLIVDENNMIRDYKLRLSDQKKASIKAFKNLGFRVFAMGDSYNDTAMLLEADKGFFFNPPEKIIADFPSLPVFHTFEALKKALVVAI